MSSESELALKKPRDEVDAFLSAQIDEGLRIHGEDSSLDVNPAELAREIKDWSRYVQEGLRATFVGERAVSEFKSALVSSRATVGPMRDMYKELREHRKRTRDGVDVLKSLQRRLDFAQELGADGTPTATPVLDDVDTSEAVQVFLVHGKDTGAREQVRRAVEQLGVMKVIVLEDEPNKHAHLLPAVLDASETPRARFWARLPLPLVVSGSRRAVPSSRGRGGPYHH